MRSLVTSDKSLGEKLGKGTNFNVVLCDGNEYNNLTEAFYRALNSGCDQIFLDCNKIDLEDIFMWGTIFNGAAAFQVKEVVLINCKENAAAKLNFYKRIKYVPANKVNIFEPLTDEADDFLNKLEMPSMLH